MTGERSVGELARDRIASIQGLLGDPHDSMARRLYGLFRDWQRADDKQRGPRLAERIADGECAIVGDWCLTHNQEENVGHAFDNDRVGTLD